MRYKRVYVNGERVYEHRFLAEQRLGRKLQRNECVHHINGNKLDNSLENLAVLSLAEHSAMHRHRLGTGKFGPYKDADIAEFVCEYCKTRVRLDESRIRKLCGRKRKFCSRSCIGADYAAKNPGKMRANARLGGIAKAERHALNAH